MLYQDDGISTRAEMESAFRTTRISRTNVPGGTSIRVQRLHDGYTPTEPYYLIRVLATARPTAVTVGGTRLRIVASADVLDDAREDAYWWDERLRTTVVKVFDRAADTAVNVLWD
jgi:hypothetical protein